jgi:3-oxoacyl-[acyl-carrier-protein] synthase II
VGAEVRGFDARQYVRPRKSLKVMSTEIQMAFAAAQMAVEDARLATEQLDPTRLGVVFGSEMFYGDIPELGDLYAACMVNGQYDHARFGPSIAAHLFPLWMLKYLPNMAACHIGIAHNAQGPNNTIVLGEVSSALALIEAASVIQRDLADVVIVGGTGTRLSMTNLMYRGAVEVSRREEDPQRAARPFDADRDGMVNGEGAGGLVLESLLHARRRGAPVLARLLGWASGFGEPGEGNQLRKRAVAEVIEQAIERAGIDRRQVDHVHAQGLSTREDDAVEAQGICRALGEVPVTASSSYYGHLGAAGGAVQLITATLSVEHGVVPATANFSRPDPECPVQVVHGAARSRRAPAVVVVNAARTGQATAVVLGLP